jgi:hypothetical protein
MDATSTFKSVTKVLGLRILEASDRIKKKPTIKLRNYTSLDFKGQGDLPQ